MSNANKFKVGNQKPTWCRLSIFLIFKVYLTLTNNKKSDIISVGERSAYEMYLTNDF